MAYDEMKSSAGGVRGPYRAYENWLLSLPPDLLRRKHEEADMLFRRLGITFAVYGDQDGTERLIPFDTVPRIISAKEWTHLSTGCCQRVRALNAFLNDLYHGQDILKAGIIPKAHIMGNGMFRPEMQGVDVARDVYVHVAGIDLVRTGENDFYVLEDNLRSPSGVSYMLENRAMMMRLFPDLFARHRVAAVDDYPDILIKNLRSVAPAKCKGDPTVVMMTPGYYNSAYFEHAFLAEQMGIELVEGRDLFVSDGLVWMRTTTGPKRVDVIYRRIDDDFMDPDAFNPDSSLGVRGLLEVYRKGGVTLANAIGTGVADDKATYTYVPEMIRFYLGEEPILNNVPTWRLEREDERKYVLEHLAELVVKEVQGAGGYGMLVGPTSTKQQIEEFRLRILANPSNYIAQPTLALSTVPTLVEQGIAPRHVDLRPYVLAGETVTLVPGGLTRVALTEGSLVVNSSQGGGTKDTWVLENDPC
ncbi:circularly permuted type 2 ATP-grasp protein [Magnetospirillum sulfuroxidans]|uniref:Circularly permuted type 2 ATP-grasp protein n=1 Tax=Magnetospirillum sulfuroxidans TaxID=611300 RepID=A0ABS5IGW4_9PROT|nr:circularly permuted type 2 ATP-grasp protein [Magnetospirillum sulfuroxidans]MBR9973676.1 circularly permuted type 2 ATP-grasp protein [Magnetospirillum sulfuroxidans]